MELQFEDNEYYLVDDNNDTVATTDKILLKEYDIYMKKLSKENCDEIFGVVDVFKLAYDSSQEFLIEPIESPTFTFGYEQGFDKAMELNKDKLFTVEDLYRVFLINSAGNNTTLRHFFEETVLSMFEQPTEIEVEIRCWIGNGDKESDSFKDPLVTNTGISKLDENGCLILRRI